LGRFHAAIDVGGTFIDVVLIDTRSKDVRISKVLHRRGAQGADIIAAIGRMISSFEANISELETIVMGTTVVTNALLEGRLAKTALLTTEGFRDVLEIARMTRPSSYDPHQRRAAPVVPRYLRLEVHERLAQDGQILEALDEATIIRHVAMLRREAVEAIAICLLFSFVDPSHELQVREILERELRVPISLSSDVHPVFREYERTTATALNAATTPLMSEFLDGVGAVLERGVTRAFVMGSSGGCLTFSEARRYPIKCVTSGPAGGVIGALRLADQCGIEEALTLDVGGTSSDVAMLRNRALPYSDGRAVGGYPIALSSVEVETVGAGGGSVAYLDRAGLLKVGPRSAGADPGPVCYARGGLEPTVTDAHVALNRLGTQSMLSGDFTLDRDAAIGAIEERIARPLNLTWSRAAHGILQVTTANIVRAVRTMSVERGHDPRRMALIAFGGAGPLHAIEVARILEIPKVYVPAYPGVWSAFGILATDIQYSTQRTWFRALDQIKEVELESIDAEIAKSLMQRVRADGFLEGEAQVERAVDLRFKGQSHSLPTHLPEATRAGLAVAERCFRLEHELRYGHAPSSETIELVNLRLIVRIPRPRTAVQRLIEHSEPRPKGIRSLWIDDAAADEAQVHWRDDLATGSAVTGPAIVEQYDSTIVLGRGDRLEVLDDAGTALVYVAADLPGTG
jgi:N-methylhydantoinase A